MKRLAALALCFLSSSFAATTPPVTTPPLTLQQALQRVGKVYSIDCGSREPGAAVIEIYDVLNQHPYWTTTVGLNQMPLAQTVYSGGPAVVFIKVTCSTASGNPPPKSVIYKFHYPDAPVVVGPAAPTSIKVI